MVLGVSKLFGFDLKDNFRQPYFSTTLADFWHRWHITLGDWMRDYIFYPLAVTKPMLNIVKWGTKTFGKTGRILPAVIGNIVVFFLVGVWHGTGWNYVLWGFYNGILISVSELLKPAFGRLNGVLHIGDKSKGLYVWRIIRTNIFIALGEIIVMVADVAELPTVLSHIFTRPDFGFGEFSGVLEKTLLKPDGRIFIIVFMFVALAIVIVRSVVKERGVDLYGWVCRRNFVVQSIILCFLIFTMLSAFIFQNVGGGFLYANF